MQKDWRGAGGCVEKSIQWKQQVLECVWFETGSWVQPVRGAAGDEIGGMVGCWVM